MRHDHVQQIGQWQDKVRHGDQPRGTRQDLVNDIRYRVSRWIPNGRIYPWPNKGGVSLLLSAVGCTGVWPPPPPPPRPWSSSSSIVREFHHCHPRRRPRTCFVTGMGRTKGWWWCWSGTRWIGRTVVIVIVTVTTIFGILALWQLVVNPAQPPGRQGSSGVLFIVIVMIIGWKRLIRILHCQRRRRGWYDIGTPTPPWQKRRLFFWWWCL